MVTRERRLDRAQRLLRRALAVTGDELREGRLQSGLTQRELGSRVGISHSHVSRIERGLIINVPYGTLVRVGAVVGLDIPLRTYPNGDRVRDAAQIATLARFRATLPAQLGWRAEVPLQRPGDLRAWDAVISGPGWRLPIEAETRIRDVQAMLRRIALKQRDDNAQRIILLVADTRNNDPSSGWPRPNLRQRFQRPIARWRPPCPTGSRPLGAASSGSSLRALS